jgi:hypothetical protein
VSRQVDQHDRQREAKAAGQQLQSTKMLQARSTFRPPHGASPMEYWAVIR